MYKNEKTRVKSVQSYSGVLRSESTNLLRSFAVTVLAAFLSISGLFWTAKEHATIVVKSCWESCVHHFTSHLIHYSNYYQYYLGNDMLLCSLNLHIRSLGCLDIVIV